MPPPAADGAGGDGGWLWIAAIPRWLGRPTVQVGDDRPADRQRVLVVGREMVDDPRDASVDIATAELLSADLLAGGRLHERRTAEEDRARPLDDHGLVAHRRDVRPAGRAAAHDEGDLGHAGRGEAGLVVEDPAEVVAVGKDLTLEGQERPAAVDEVDARQPVLEGDLLGPQVLLHGERVVRAALDRRVVGDDDAERPLDPPDPGHDPGARRIAVVQPVGGERAQLEEGACPGRAAGRCARGRAACRARGDARSIGRRRRRRDRRQRLPLPEVLARGRPSRPTFAWLFRSARIKSAPEDGHAPDDTRRTCSGRASAAS